jgi:hypothetical protein
VTTSDLPAPDDVPAISNTARGASAARAMTTLAAADGVASHRRSVRRVRGRSDACRITSTMFGFTFAVINS